MTPRRTVYRSKATIVWGNAGTALNVVLVIGMFVSILGSDSRAISDAGAIAVVVVIAAGIAGLNYRLVRRGVFVEPDKVTVRSVYLLALATVSIVLVGPGVTVADNGRFHDAAGDNTSGSADVDLISATASHVRGKTDWLRHTATVRGDLPADREDWPWLVIDLGSQWRYFIDPRYNGGQLIAVGPSGGHLAPVVRVDHNTVRYEFKTRWLDLGRVGEYCWSFTTFNNQGNGRDAMPDSVGLGDGAPSIQGGYRHVLRPSDTNCRD